MCRFNNREVQLVYIKRRYEGKKGMAIIRSLSFEPLFVQDKTHEMKVEKQTRKKKKKMKVKYYMVYIY